MTNRDEDFDADFQLATEEAFRGAPPFAGPNAEPKPYGADGLPADPILRWFGPPMQPDIAQADKIHAIRAHFRIVAQWLVDSLPRCPERTVALRKMLEAKDSAVRAALE